MIRGLPTFIGQASDLKLLTKQVFQPHIRQKIQTPKPLFFRHRGRERKVPKESADKGVSLPAGSEERTRAPSARAFEKARVKLLYILTVLIPLSASS